MFHISRSYVENEIGIFKVNRAIAQARKSSCAGSYVCYGKNALFFFHPHKVSVSISTSWKKTNENWALNADFPTIS